VRHILFFFLGAFAAVVYGQNQRVVDSLHSKLAALTDDTLRVNLLNELAWEYRYSSPDTALQYGSKALMLARSLGYKLGEAEALYQTGNIHRYQGRYVQAIEVYTEGIRISENVGDKRALAKGYDMIGGMLRIQGNFSTATDYYQRSLKLTDEVGDVRGQIAALISLGVIKRQLHQYNEALPIFEDAFARARQIKDRQGEAIALNCLGQVRFDQGLLPEAMSFYQRSLFLKLQIGDKRGMAITHNCIAQVYIKSRRNTEAKAEAQAAIITARSIGLPEEVRDAFETLYRAYDAEGDFRNAYFYHLRYTTLKDSLLDAEKSRRIGGLESAYQLQKKQIQIEKLEQTQFLQRWVIVAVVLFLVFGGFFIVGLWRVNKRRAVLYQELRLRNEEIYKANAKLNGTLDELHATQDQLVASEKMVALGRLVANVAHEINTPLGVIRAMASKLGGVMPQVLEELPSFMQTLDAEAANLFSEALVAGNAVDFSLLSTREERQVKRKLEEELAVLNIQRPSEFAVLLLSAGIMQPAAFLPLLRHPRATELLRMASRVKQLRTGLNDISLATDKTRRVVYALKSFSVNETRRTIALVNIRESVEGVLHLYYGQLQGIELERAWLHEAVVQADPYELEIVWMHLLFNAIQALAGKGQIRITLKAAPTDKPMYAQLSVADNGPGITQTLLQRIFEPFFTTRPEGEGSGLGLYVSRKIVVEHHGGTLDVESTPGNTVFTVTLPLHVPAYAAMGGLSLAPTV